MIAYFLPEEGGEGRWSNSKQLPQLDLTFFFLPACCSHKLACMPKHLLLLKFCTARSRYELL